MSFKLCSDRITPSKRPPNSEKATHDSQDALSQIEASDKIRKGTDKLHPIIDRHHSNVDLNGNDALAISSLT